ncbi:flagellar biosynthesis protein FlaG [Photobacterium phosphoreum]|uniref:Flagellar biosynthesis protein FlaG n=1 Tax=Photobacterium phosphoreum TaxID=659 RepID=A0A2T3JXE3_PHOPO|nr:flagellar protein FlaG [Photobacterium phosphoreum]PSU27644.1 flagellar biosynthesis protein FlaG [Photobacterium phosphoreum]PSU41592.1 flagellar biosynthesis protein FlaG [Photobacterium phosphoreum]PSU54081.1 flagellar biosynthesis protein FlaG [Photobacterium phosphoreum]
MAITSTAATGQYTALQTLLNSTTSATVNTVNQSKSDPTYSELQPSGKPLPLITALTDINDINHPLDDNPLNSFTLDSIAEQERIKQIEQVLQQVNRSLQFHVDDDSGEHIATIVDNKTGEVIRQVPAQELLELNKNLAKHALGSISKTV